MAKWKQNKSEPCEVVRVDGEDVGHICDCALPETAEQIITEHNAHEALLAALKGTVAFMERVGYVMKDTDAARAIALGEKTK